MEFKKVEPTHIITIGDKRVLVEELPEKARREVALLDILRQEHHELNEKIRITMHAINSIKSAIVEAIAPSDTSGDRDTVSE